MGEGPGTELGPPGKGGALGGAEIERGLCGRSGDMEGQVSSTGGLRVCVCLSLASGPQGMCSLGISQESEVGIGLLWMRWGS